MIHIRNIVLILFVGCALSLNVHAKAATSLAKELAVFEPFLGVWEAQFPFAAGQDDVTDIAKWERALNGTAVRTLHSVNEGEYGGESLIFWDASKQKLVFYYFTTAGFYTQGWMEVENGTQFVAYEDVTGSAQGITQVKSTSEFIEGEFVVTTQYLQNGSWTQPQQRIYRRSNKQVIFK